MNVSVDTSDLLRLIAYLEHAIVRTPAERSAALEKVAARVESEARANAASFHTASTGELAASITRTGTPLFQTVSAPVRQAWFLEAGSPTTGAPRPWMSEPGESGALELLGLIGELGALW